MYVLFFRDKPVQVVTEQTTASRVPAATAEARPLGPQPEAITLPPLDQSDEVVRTLGERLSKHPLVLAVLGTHNLIRTFAAAMVNIGEGVSPASLLGVLRPKQPFSTTERGGVEYIASDAYERYAPFADAVRSVDATEAARLYATLKPRIEEAYRDLGFPNQRFDEVVRRVFVQLLQTPTIEGPVEVTRKGALYQYADARLEELSAAQKLLLRMGPRNGRIVKDKIREIAAALGIPADSLPPPSVDPVER